MHGTLPPPPPLLLELLLAAAVDDVAMLAVRTRMKCRLAHASSSSKAVFKKTACDLLKYEIHHAPDPPHRSRCQSRRCI